MKSEKDFHDILNKLMRKATIRLLADADFKEICEYLGICKMYYEIRLRDVRRYMDYKTERLVLPGMKAEDRIYLFDNGEETGLRKQYDYMLSENDEAIYAFVEFREGLDEQAIDWEKCRDMIDLVYLLVSRQNMRFMLNHSEMMDDHTGVPNLLFIQREYEKVTKKIPAENFTVLYINLQNFKYFNEVGGVKSGDEVILQYAHRLTTFIGQDEGLCHLDGDNFVLFIKNKNLDRVIQNLQSVHIDELVTLPDVSFDIMSWIGISESAAYDERTITTRIEEAAAACNMGKSQKLSVVVYSKELENNAKHNMELIAMFPEAVRNHEIRPFFQAKVDMQTGQLVGFEALCRWIHNGKFIYPVQFIPLLEREGLVHELDTAIFRETCRAIKSWKDMGLNPPCISFNFSRLNLFIPGIEQKIFQIMQEFGVSAKDIEVEITETVNESEYSRLVNFVHNLKDRGIHVSIDDFGTGFSSLSLIHSIDADVIKIDKSFVDALPGDKKSEILIKSVINIANHMNMSVIVEGVETIEQARELMRFGCRNVQGFLFSKPVDYEAATEMIKNPHFKAL